MNKDVVGSTVGTAGAVVSCSVMMFAVFPALAGVVGASASSMAMGMVASQPAWVRWVSHYSLEMVIVSIGFLLWGVWRSSRLVQLLVGIGMVILLVGQFAMVNVLVIPSLSFILGGNVVGWIQRTNPRRSLTMSASSSPR